MDQADEQDRDVENPGGGGSLANGANGGTNGTNGTIGTNGQHQTPEGSLYQEENEESDLDDEPQDDEDMLTQPLQVNPQSLDAASVSSLAHLSNFMSTHHPQLMAKMRLENEPDILQQGRNFEALHAVMTSSNLGNLFPPLYMSPPPALPLPQTLQNHSQVAGNLGNQVAENQALACSASSTRASVTTTQSNESSPPRCRNNGETPQGSSRNNGETREGEARAASVNSQHPPGTNWSFEEQFRQLYELDDTSERKAFLDDLFTFMQARGTPISRLPIMAKSVLDLFELYKLVVQRGGLVEVINKKLWQEIIKGLRLPASITSAAFTLRTQYMKYLYPYEKEKEGLSTQEQLQTAIETNRRESRRNNYAAYSSNNDTLVTRNQHNSLPSNPLQAISLAHMAAAANESQHHVVNGHPHASQHHPQHFPPNMGNIGTSNSPTAISEYMARIFRERSGMPGNPLMQGSTSTPPPTTADGFKTSVHFWNQMYTQTNNNLPYAGIIQPSFSPASSHSPLAPTNSPEPQREALDLANSGHRSDPVSSPATSRSPSRGDAKRSREEATGRSPATPTKRMKRLSLSDEEGNNRNNTQTLDLKRLKVINDRENGRTPPLLDISVKLNGILFEGILPGKEDNDDGSSSSLSPNNNETQTRQNSDS